MSKQFSLWQLMLVVTGLAVLLGLSQYGFVAAALFCPAVVGPIASLWRCGSRHGIMPGILFAYGWTFFGGCGTTIALFGITILVASLPMPPDWAEGCFLLFVAALSGIGGYEAGSIEVERTREEAEAINAAIVRYLGYQGGFEWPQRREDLIRSVCRERSGSILAAIRICLDDVGTFRLRWDEKMPADAYDRFRSELKARHKWLSEVALDALWWKFTCGHD